jgi:rhamnose utilization protein RhaD (predicted bifunctional aldolase and dehydrogenase)
VAVSVSKALAVLEDPGTSDATMTEGLMAALVDARETRRPSAEVMFHAFFYTYPEYRFAGHTHPVFTNMLLCSKQAKEWAAGRIYPDHVVVMGHKSVYIPYIDPGVVRVREMRKQIEWFLRDEAELPRAIMMQNHGLIAVGDSAQTVTSVTDMAEKAARIIMGAAALGGPEFMSQKDVARIHVRTRLGNGPPGASTPVTLW